MAKLPEGTATRIIRDESWLPGETVTIQTFAGSDIQAVVTDALTDVQVNPATRQILRAQFTPGNASLVARVLAVKAWTLIYEESGHPIPCTEANVRGIDAEYAVFIDTEIARDWKLWETATGKERSNNPDPVQREKEDAATRKTFPQGAALPDRGSLTEDACEAPVGDGAPGE